MRIKKKEPSVGILGKIINSFSSSKQDTYSADYINTALEKTYSKEEIENFNRYSTEETFTGKYWIDGKKIYRKVVFSSLHSGDNNIPFNIQNLDKAFIANNSYIYTNGRFLNPNMLNAGSNIDSQFIKTVINKNNNELLIYLGGYLITGETNCAITLEYTKTTD